MTHTSPCAQVRHTPPYEVVTQAQRMQFLQAALRRMAAAGISYRHQAGENRIKLSEGRCNG